MKFNRNFARAVLLGLGGAAAVMLQPALAMATTFDWSYAGFNGVPVTAMGQLTATPVGGGAFAVTSFSGMRNGSTITGLSTYAGDDNEVFSAGPFVDYFGLAYTDSSGAAYNVYYDASLTDAYACGHIGYCEIGPGTVGTSGLSPPDSIGQISGFTLAAVPEPASWALMVIGVGLSGACLRRRQMHWGQGPLA